MRNNCREVNTAVSAQLGRIVHGLQGQIEKHSFEESLLKQTRRKLVFPKTASVFLPLTNPVLADSSLST